MKSIKVFIVIFLCLFCTSCREGTEQKDKEEVTENWDVVIGSRYYASSVISSLTLKEILEGEGYCVKVEYEDEELFEALSNNSINVCNSLWLYQTDYKKYKSIDSTVIDLGPNSENYSKGLLVPEYTTIGDIGELNNYKNMTKGIIYCLEEFDYLYDITLKTLEKYELDYSIQIITEKQLESFLTSSYEVEDWFVIAGFSPNYLLDKYRMRFLVDYKMTYGRSQDIHTIINETFYTTNTEIVNIVDSFYLYDWELNNLLNEVKVNNQQTTEKIIEKWIEDHPEVKKRCMEP